MKTNSRLLQTGSFTVELALVLMVLCLIYLFSTDLSHKLLMQSALDRTSFALVNILKERTRYYDGDVQDGTNLNVQQQQLEDMQKLAARLLGQEADSVMINIQSLTEGEPKGDIESEALQTVNCEVPEIDSETFKNLVPVEDGVIYPLYSVTVCETYPSWFGVFTNSSETLTLSSTSVMPGR
ncbi:tight adherence pilus pseudopilin TadF [Vibrio splendidus]|uniref:tight adherence pilus pseudopilin TadF n=1 Tax=Vibrio splendidus TaxID=29497 RepID=UPI00352C2EAB